MTAPSSPACPLCAGTHLVAMEYRDLYDGVAAWHCCGCEHEWPAFPAWDPLYRVMLDRIANAAPASLLSWWTGREEAAP